MKFFIFFLIGILGVGIFFLMSFFLMVIQIIFFLWSLVRYFFFVRVCCLVKWEFFFIMLFQLILWVLNIGLFLQVNFILLLQRILYELYILVLFIIICFIVVIVGMLQGLVSLVSFLRFFNFLFVKMMLILFCLISFFKMLRQWFFFLMFLFLVVMQNLLVIGFERNFLGQMWFLVLKL